jgi:hypothetical protein
MRPRHGRPPLHPTRQDIWAVNILLVNGHISTVQFRVLVKWEDFHSAEGGRDNQGRSDSQLAWVGTLIYIYYTQQR